jgi:hypothetical protein
VGEKHLRVGLSIPSLLLLLLHFISSTEGLGHLILAVDPITTVVVAAPPTNINNCLRFIGVTLA